MEGDSSFSTQDKLRDILDKRNQERKTVLENKKTKTERSKLEGIDYFESVFDEKVCEIENSLNCLQSNDIKLLDTFTLIGKNIQDLQKYFSSSTIFLSDYKIKSCQNSINQLIIKAEDTKSRLIPKKKFGFSKKVAKVVEKPNPVNEVAHGREAKKFEWTVAKQTGIIISLSPEQTNSQDITLSELSNCIIEIKGHLGSLQLSQIKDCVVLCGPVARSVFIENSERCNFAFSCQQLRLHSSRYCDIYLHVTSRAIIEDSMDIFIATNNFTYPEHDQDLIRAGLDANCNNWLNIGDFNWLSSDEPSPNWHVMEESKKITDWSQFKENFKAMHSIN